jgi:hypothetical protein
MVNLYGGKLFSQKAKLVYTIFLFIQLITQPTQGQVITSESFENVSLLTTNGWQMTNQSTTIGLTNWFQGNPSVFPAHQGQFTNSYVAANFNNTTGSGTISNWLITPTVNVKDGDVLSFYTRVPTSSPFNDRLEVRSSLGPLTLPTGGPAEIGSFTNLLLSINPLLNLSYPDNWTEFRITISGVGTVPVSMNFAFRYFVPNGGPFGANSSYIGIDTFEIQRPREICEDFIALSNALENGLFFQGSNHQRLAVDLPVKNGFTLYGIEPTVVDEATYFNFTFYSDNNGVPGIVLETRTGLLYNSTITGSNFGFDFHKYFVGFNTPINLASNTTFWLEIETDAVAWESSSLISSKLGYADIFNHDGTMGNWVSTQEDNLVFNLICDPITLPYTWNGNQNTNWHNNLNWSPALVPSTLVDVVIPNGRPNYPQINVDAFAKSILAHSNATVLVKSNSTLTIENEITNQNALPHSFIFETDANLLQNNPLAVNSGNIRAERFVQNMNNILPTHMDYVYWSSPVTGQAIHNGTNSIFSPGTPLNRNYQYNESNDYFVPTPDFSFKIGKGYAIRAESGPNPETPGFNFINGYDKTYRFVGVPNNGQILSDETLKYTDVNHGYNLTGNPYPSNMDLDRFFLDNSTKIETVAYLWTNNTPSPYQQGSSYNGISYAIYNESGGIAATAGPSEYDQITIPNGIVSVGQGFIVKAKSGGLHQPLVFNNNQRLADAGAFYQRNTTDRFWVTLTSPDEIVNMILVGYNEDAVDEYDFGFDAPIMYLYSDAIYSIVENERLGINGLKAPFHIDDVIPLGINPFSTGRYVISLHQFEGVFEDQHIFLKDKLFNITHNLSKSPYEFRTTPGQHNHRFEIVFKSRPMLHSASQGLSYKTDLTITKKDKSISIESLEEKIKEVEIFDLFGKSIYKKENIQAKTHTIPQSLFSHQILIVRAKTESGKIESKKLILE